VYVFVNYLLQNEAQWYLGKKICCSYVWWLISGEGFSRLCSQLAG